MWGEIYFLSIIQEQECRERKEDERRMKGGGIVPYCCRTENHYDAFLLVCREADRERETYPQREGQVTAPKRDRDIGLEPRLTPPGPLFQPLCCACKHCWPYNTQWTPRLPLGPTEDMFWLPLSQTTKKTTVSSVRIKVQSISSEAGPELSDLGVVITLSGGRSSAPTWADLAEYVHTPSTCCKSHGWKPQSTDGELCQEKGGAL